MQRTIGLLALVWLAASAFAAETPAPTYLLSPSLKLEKEEYVLGEEVRFWVGVTGKRPVPKELQRDGQLRVRTPSGEEYAETISWPIDGMVDATWTGGHGFGNRQVQEGTYTLVLEMNGIATPPLKLVVKRLPLLDKIAATFRFAQDGGRIEPGQDVEVVFQVINNSQETVRFEALHAAATGVSVRLDWAKGGSGDFYDWDKLRGAGVPKSNVLVDVLNWRTVKMAEVVTLPPGQTYSLKLSLKDAKALERTGKVKVTLRTTLQLLIGEKDDAYAKLCPVRLPVSASAAFDVAAPVPATK